MGRGCFVRHVACKRPTHRSGEYDLGGAEHWSCRPRAAIAARTSSVASSLSRSARVALIAATSSELLKMSSSSRESLSSEPSSAASRSPFARHLEPLVVVTADSVGFDRFARASANDQVVMQLVLAQCTSGRVWPLAAAAVAVVAVVTRFASGRTTISTTSAARLFVRLCDLFRFFLGSGGGLGCPWAWFCQWSPMYLIYGDIHRGTDAGLDRGPS